MISDSLPCARKTPAVLFTFHVSRPLRCPPPSSGFPRGHRFPARRSSQALQRSTVARNPSGRLLKRLCVACSRHSAVTSAQQISDRWRCLLAAWAARSLNGRFVGRVTIACRTRPAAGRYGRNNDGRWPARTRSVRLPALTCARDDADSVPPANYAHQLLYCASYCQYSEANEQKLSRSNSTIYHNLSALVCYR